MRHLSVTGLVQDLAGARLEKESFYVDALATAVENAFWHLRIHPQTCQRGKIRPPITSEYEH